MLIILILSVVILSIIILTIVILSVFMLSVLILSVAMLGIVILSDLMMPFVILSALNAECSYAECCYQFSIPTEEKILQCYVTEKRSNETKPCIVPFIFENRYSSWIVRVG